jgi:signal transduction histidine kinase
MDSQTDTTRASCWYQHPALLLFFGCAGLALTTAVCFLLNVRGAMAGLLYVTVVVLVSLRRQLIPAILVSLVAVICLDYFFVNPTLRLGPAESLDVAALAAYLTTAIVITGLLSRVQRSVDELRRSKARLKRTNEDLRLELDSLAQFFTGISLQLEMAKELKTDREDEALNFLERASDLTQIGLGEARRSALSLRSDVIEDSGLTEALRMLAERSDIPGRLSCRFRATTLLADDLPLQVQQHLLRIAQQAISSAICHGNPTLLNVLLQSNSSELVLQIDDNGTGISATQLRTGEGFGLCNMRERAKQIGADLDIRTAPGGGASVIVRLPSSVAYRQ